MFIISPTHCAVQHRSHLASLVIEYFKPLIFNNNFWVISSEVSMPWDKGAVKRYMARGKRKTLKDIKKASLVR